MLCNLAHLGARLVVEVSVFVFGYRFNTELQQSLFQCLVTASNPDDALRLLQNAGHLSLRKNTVSGYVFLDRMCRM